jgi:hypothetical protein
METFRSGQYAASRQPKGGDPVAGRWQRDGDDVTDRSHRPFVPPPRSPLIRHSDELYCSAGSLQDAASRRVHG